MTNQEVVKFLEWVTELLPPEYDFDTRRRFTPQIVQPHEPFVWIETRKYRASKPEFYTTAQLLELYQKQKK